MSGDWLKMRHDLPDDPAVIRISATLGIDDDAVIGKLFRVWSWADRHTHDGTAEGIGLDWLDRYARCQGFGAALVRAGWLVESDAGLSFPRFDRHCSDTAKARALTKNRVERHRNASSVTGALPEKRREEYPPPPREDWETIRQAWNAGSGRPWKPATPPVGLVERLAEPGWAADALEAIGRLKACRFFRTPPTLVQFVKPGFVANVLGGQYDEPKATTARADAPPPPRVDPAFAAAREATLAREAKRRAEEHARLDRGGITGGA